MDVNAQVCASCGAAVVQKNPILALVLSLLFPGLGQLYNGQNRKGITLIIAYVVFLILSLILIGIILAILIWLYGMYDAFTSAKALNNGETVEDRIF
jgi:TM2 domain-containing membrane protein YozV